MGSIPKSTAATASPSILESLPLEITQNILASLEDIFSLISAALTGPYLFNAIRSSEEFIATQVLVNQISPALIRDALIAQESSSYRKGDKSHEEFMDLIERYIAGQREICPPPLRWKIADGVPIARFHRTIRYLSNDLASMVLNKHPMSGKPDLAHAPPSRGEINRIERAHYRLEIYSNLFWRSDSYTFEEGSHQCFAFFSRFSPWENEQLACLRDCISTVLLRVYKQTALDNTSWLTYFLHRTPTTPFLEHHLQHGLSHIHRLLTSSNPNDKCCPPPQPSDYQRPFCCINFNDTGSLPEPWLDRPSDGLTLDLQDAYVDRERYQRIDLPKTLLAVYDSADEEKFVPRPVCQDPDPGPEEVWRWAHDQQPVMYFVGAYAQAPLRDWGYVFWDMERLERWGVFERYWEGEDWVDLVEQEERRMRMFKKEVEKRAEMEGIQVHPPRRGR